MSPPPPRSVYRHRPLTRLWHWINAVAIFVMIGSGLTILNAHPHLYWGEYGANFDTPWISFSRFPGWLTIPSTYNLALARRWHLFFALVLGFGLLLFLLGSLVNRHIARDLTIRRGELAPRHLWADFRAHLAFRFHDPEAPRDYNSFQKLSYVAMLFGVLPLVILTGITLSPGMNAAWPWLLDLFGGRASARSIHFLAAAAIVVFTVIHLVLVILAGPINEVRSMLTGWWRVPEEEQR
ncbi:cytochrome b/b6 domain-containing protein [Sphingomonas sp. ac-8]|uniref:cytochrome b/b6 domain-containing protein n=1 Tax=Sphingomonas sp. ac-8 TaxID=3242977 RepID=UPI003A81372D